MRHILRVAKQLSCHCAALIAFAGSSVLAQDMTPPSSFKDCEACPEMVVIPPGKFMMGATKQDAQIPHTQHSIPAELPRHKVTISRPFAIGKFEVTVENIRRYTEETGEKVGGKCGIRLADSGPHKHKYTGTLHPDSKNVYGNNFVYISDGSFEQPGLPVSDRHPAVCISRPEAKAYLKWLSSKTGREYRLPTEAEWEYAARAGSETPFFWGKNPSKACRYANFADKDSFYMGMVPASCREAIRPLWAAPAGSYEPNAWGLHDMVGSVQEMLEDCWHKNYRGAPTDGSAWMDSQCSLFIARGGDYELPVSAMRSSERLFYGDETNPHDRYNVLGFRVAAALADTASDNSGGSPSVARKRPDRNGGDVCADSDAALSQSALTSAGADDARAITILIKTLYHTTPDGVVDHFAPSLLALSPEQQVSFLAPELAATLGSDAADRDRIALCVGFGPLVDGQDWKIEHFDIEQPIVESHRAATRATFQNMGRPTSIEFRLRKTPQGWRITELGDLNRMLEVCQ